MDVIERNEPLAIICKAGEALQIALSQRDEYTQLHCQRVAQIAVQTGRYFDFDDSLLAQLEAAAIFHDIGKIGIPDEILLNPGKLTEAQYEQMKSHALLGASIVEKLELSNADNIAQIIRHHHEHYDGSGYPDGLKGDEIPLPSRIICIVDVFDALTSNRCYRDATNTKNALDYMAEEMGQKFDPSVFEVVSQVIMKIELTLPEKTISDLSSSTGSR